MTENNETPSPSDRVDVVSDIEAKEVCGAITELLNSGNYKPDGGSYRTFRRARAVIERYLYASMGTPSPEPNTMWRWKFEAQGVWCTGPEVPPDVYQSEVMAPSPAPNSRGNDAPLTISLPVHQIAHDLLKAHTGQEGGCPKIDWYRLRSEISDAIAVALDSQRRTDTPPAPNVTAHATPKPSL